MKLAIRNQKLGRKITFSRPGSHYIFLDTNRQPGTLGHQPTDHGSTLTYSGDDQGEFEKICRAWYRRHKADLEAALDASWWCE